MKIIGRDLLEAFCSSHADARSWIEAWLLEVGGMSWDTPRDIKNRYVTASILPGNRVVFNVRGNHYRLEVHVTYRNRVVTVQRIGTHREYDERNRRR
ncbi:MAG: type II toxin-antitoxin system HigB family toxin [Steroidobacteraceae bacterium]